MAENLVINEVTYPEVKAISVETTEGEQAMYYPDAVRYTEQTLTEAQQEQARTNIAAASVAEVSQLSEEIADYFEEVEINSSNLLNADAITTGKYIVPKTGALSTNASYGTTDYIPVEVGKTYTFQYGGKEYDTMVATLPITFLSAFDADKNVIANAGATHSEANPVRAYTVPDGVKYIRFSATQLLNIASQPTVGYAFVASTELVPWEAFESTAKKVLKAECHNDNHIIGLIEKTAGTGQVGGNGSIYVSLPDYVNVLVGSEFKVYFRNILSRKDVLLWIGYTENLTTKYYDDYLSITATAEGTYSLPWKVYGEGRVLLDSGTLEIVAVSKTPTDVTKAIVIGDSTVNDGTMTNKVMELYNTAGATLTLLGTRGSGTHEGRGGWTAKSYCTIASSDGVANPFYNNGFDFAYYMANQGYSGVQAVAIQLGINDIFQVKDYSWSSYDSESILGYINQMVQSILAYDSTIKVIINLPTTPNSDGTSFTETYGTSQIYWYYNENIIRFAEELKDYFADNSRVVISASNCILDTKEHIRDGVHPTSDGYNLLGQRLYEVLVSVTDGSEIIVPLLDFTQRTRVVHG